MFKPKFLTYLDYKSFSSEKVSCLGSQLKNIVQYLNIKLERHIWFCGQVEARSATPRFLDINTNHLKKLGDASILINLCDDIHQFLAGVFLAVKEDSENSNYSEITVATEDKQYRPLGLNGVLIEIRAFNTSYFEIYSENLQLINHIANLFNSKVEICNLY